MEQVEMVVAIVVVVLVVLVSMFLMVYRPVRVGSIATTRSRTTQR